MPAMLETFTTVPFDLIRCGMQSLVSWTIERTFVPIISSNFSIGHSLIKPGR